MLKLIVDISSWVAFYLYRMWYYVIMKTVLILSAVYVISRFLILYLYLIENKNMNIEYRSNCFEYDFKNVRGLNPNLIDLEIPPFPITNKNSLNKWSKLYKIDVFIKSIGTCLLSIFSIVVVISGIKSNDKEYLLFAILPSCVQLFNEFLSWYQIDDPFLNKPILPKRIFSILEESKRRKGK